MTDAPLTILHVLAPADSGGLETVVRSLALGHTAMGHTVELAAVTDSPTSAFVDEARDAGLRVHVIQSPPRSFTPERRGVRALMTQRRFDVMHSHGYRSDILDIGVARALGVPSVTTLHGFSAVDRKARAYEWLQIRSARRASAIVAVSSNVSERVASAGANPRAIHLIRNAIGRVSTPVSAGAARERLGLDPGMHIGWIGRLSQEKGPDIMVDAMQYLADLPATLSFIGDGPDRDALEQQATRLGVAGKVRFHGRIADAATLISAFDAVALSSRTEGTPMVVLEAMSAGVPIVAPRVGGIPDMLSPREAALVHPEDPRALADAIRTTIADRASAEARATCAHERLITEFDLGTWLARYEALYRSIQPNSSQKHA